MSSTSSIPSPSTSPTLKRPRRPRAIQACNFCRSKKYRCDGNLPCLHCRKQNLECVFRKPEGPDPEAAAYSIGYVKLLERKLELAEARLRKATSISDISDQPAASRQQQSQTTSDGGVAASPLEHLAQPQKPPLSDENAADESETEVVDVNPDTNAIEFHGNTSSLAFLGLVCEKYGSVPSTAVTAQEPQRTSAKSPSVVTTLRNEEFSRRQHEGRNLEDYERDFHAKVARTFLDGYFDNIHFIHPIIDREDVLRRSHDLWSGQHEHQPRSFKALYFGLLSIGSMIRTWREQSIEGMGRFEWSRMLFRKAELALGRPGFSNDYFTVHALFIMAKVCQCELNPSLAYIYLGLAIRTCLSIGLNRNAPLQGQTGSATVSSVEASKTWWGLYSFEVEMSFALGRPDTLGSDEYHNRALPPVDTSEFAIIPAMLDMAKTMRETSVSIYLTKDWITEKLARAKRLEAKVDHWVEQLPSKIRPGATLDVISGRSQSVELWPNLQKLVLKIRASALPLGMAHMLIAL
jgi:hypothetical protein